MFRTHFRPFQNSSNPLTMFLDSVKGVFLKLAPVPLTVAARIDPPYRLLQGLTAKHPYRLPQAVTTKTPETSVKRAAKPARKSLYCMRTLPQVQWCGSPAKIDRDATMRLWPARKQRRMRTPRRKKRMRTPARNWWLYAGSRSRTTGRMQRKGTNRRNYCSVFSNFRPKKNQEKCQK